MKKENIIKKAICITMITTSLLGITGCQIAKDDKSSAKQTTSTQAGDSTNAQASETTSAREEDTTLEKAHNENKDLYVGVFFSDKDLIKNAKVEFTEEELEDIADGQDVKIIPQKVVGERFYATKICQTGKDSYHVDYTFEGCDGAGTFSYNVFNKEGVQMYTGGTTNGTVSDAISFSSGSNSNLGVSENGVEEGTVVVNELNMDKYRDESGNVFLNVYDVYQTKEGDIYMILSSRMNIEGGTGFEYTDDSTIKTMDGEVPYSFTVKADINPIIPPEKTILFQMDAKHKLVGTIEIDNYNIPESIDLDSETEYVIVECYIGDKVVSRTTVDMTYEDEHNLSYDEEDEETDDYKYVDLYIRDDNELFVMTAEVELKK